MKVASDTGGIQIDVIDFQDSLSLIVYYERVPMLLSIELDACKWPP